MSRLLIARPCESMMSGSDILGEKTRSYLRDSGLDVVSIQLWSDWVGLLWNSKIPGRRRLARLIIEKWSIKFLEKKIRKSDVVWLNGAAVPFDKEARFEQKLIDNGGKYIFHLQDNWFEIEGACAMADARAAIAHLIVVPTEELKAVVNTRFPNKRVVVLEEPIDVERFSGVGANRRIKEKTVLLWAGNPNNLKELSFFDEILSSSEIRDKVTLRVVSGSVKPNLQLSIEWRWTAYSPDVEVSLANDVDVALAPVTRNKYSECKGSYKVKAYMAMGLPVIGSPVGHQKRLIKHGESGYLADSCGEWIKYLAELVGDPEKCQEMGIASKRRAEKLFSHSSVMDNWSAELAMFTGKWL